MAHDLTVRFRQPADATCPLVRHHLRMRVAPEARYEFDEARIRGHLEDVVKAFRGAPRSQQMDIVETYSGNRHFAAIELGESKTVVLDYGFVELLADNIAMEYSDSRKIDRARRGLRQGDDRSRSPRQHPPGSSSHLAQRCSTPARRGT